jgi:hypothetical protein
MVSYDVAVIIAYTFIASLIYDSIIVPGINLVFKIQKEKTLSILTSTDKYFDVWQFISLIIISLFLGVLSAISFNKKWLYRFGKKYKITNHFGEEDVWTYFNNSNDIDWIYVRNHKNNLTYYGNIKLFSDSNEKRELLLGDVTVYDSDSGDFMYEMENVYLCLDYNDISIETAKKKEDENGK